MIWLHIREPVPIILVLSTVGFTCDSSATDQVCESDEKSRGAPEVGVQHGSHSLTQLM